MAKRYITWIPFRVSHNTIAHIKPVLDSNWSDVVTITETPYGRVSGDPRMLGIIEGNFSQINAVQPEGDTLLDRIKASVAPFYVQVVGTAQEAVDYCNSWYPPADGDNDYFSLDVDGFTLIDNRPEEVL